MKTLTAAKVWAASACFAALVALPHIALWGIDRSQNDVTATFIAPSALAADWQAVAPIARFKPSFQNPSAEINTSYASREHTVGMYVGYYRHQDYDHKLVSSNNVLVATKGAQWAVVARGNVAVTVANEVVTVRTAELRGASLAAQGNPERLVVWQIYWINGTLTASDYVAKAYNAFYRLIGRGDNAAVIVVYAPKKDQDGGEQAVLASFLSTNYASINELLMMHGKAGN